VIGRLLAGFGLMALCVTIHAVGVSAALNRVQRVAPQAKTLWRETLLLVFVAVSVVLLHLAEIGAWAALYVWSGALADLSSALYFSAVTYTTTGYGDIVLPPLWHFDVGIEALTGILMCGWSTGFFFAVVVQLRDANARR
jgi:hypothetical protein